MNRAAQATASAATDGSEALAIGNLRHRQLAQREGARHVRINLVRRLDEPDALFPITPGR